MPTVTHSLAAGVSLMLSLLLTAAIVAAAAPPVLPLA